MFRSQSLPNDIVLVPSCVSAVIALKHDVRLVRHDAATAVDPLISLTELFATINGTFWAVPQ